MTTMLEKNDGQYDVCGNYLFLFFIINKSSKSKLCEKDNGTAFGEKSVGCTLILIGEILLCNHNKQTI